MVQASSDMVIEGKPAALVGDLVSCPIPGHRTNPIIEGSQYMSFKGRDVAVDGCKTACGCALISSMPTVGSDLGEWAQEKYTVAAEEDDSLSDLLKS